MRKEEKRLARSGKREGGGVGDDHVAMLRAQGFDPEQLRKQRYMHTFLSFLLAHSQIHTLFFTTHILHCTYAPICTIMLHTLSCPDTTL